MRGRIAKEKWRSVLLEDERERTEKENSEVGEGGLKMRDEEIDR